MPEASKSGTLTAISENSRVKLGFAIFVLFACGYWAATLESKINTLILLSQNNQSETAEMRKEIREFDRRLLAVEIQQKKP